MQVEVRPSTRTRLPLLPRIDSHPLIRLEGYNGIGKTLTIRLLQLLSGRVPFSDPRSWASFVDGLGAVDVTIRGLHGAQEVAWRVEATRLPRRLPEEVAVEDWFDASVDGQAVDPAALQRLLTVHRLPGDIGLSQTLAQQIEADRRVFVAWHPTLTDPDGSVLRATLDRLSGADELLRRVNATAVTESRHAADSAARELESRRAELEQALSRRAQLARAATLKGRIEEYQRVGGDVRQEILKLDRELEAVQLQRRKAREEMAVLEDAAARSEGARRRLRTARKRLDTSLSTVAQLNDELRQLIAIAGMEDPSQAEAEAATARNTLTLLMGRRVAVDATPMLQTVLAELEAILKRAVSTGLGDQVLLSEQLPEVLTVDSLLARVQQRAAALRMSTPSEQAAAISEEIDALAARIEALARVPVVRTALERSKELTSAVEAEMRDLLKEADSDAADALEAMRLELRRLDRLAADLTRERTLLALREEAAGGGRSLEEMTSELAKLLASAKGTADTVEGLLAVQNELVDATQRAVTAANVKVTEAMDSAARHSEELRLVVNALRDDPGLTWLRSTTPLPDVSNEVDLQLKAIETIRASVHRALERAGRLRTSMLAIDEAMERLVQRLRSMSEKSGDAYVEELTNGYGAEFASWFDAKLVRQALLPDAAHVDTVDLHADRLEVKWTTTNGAPRSRPLDAFSRGEQAYAYTSARLAALDSETRSENRLIFLDEFGAFIARDRQAKLIALLKERIKRSPNDQIVLVLPVLADYEGQMRVATDAEAARLKSIIDQLNSHGYYTQQL